MDLKRSRAGMLKKLKKLCHKISERLTPWKPNYVDYFPRTFHFTLYLGLNKFGILIA
jgi:hypothetical protein